MAASVGQSPEFGTRGRANNDSENPFTDGARGPMAPPRPTSATGFKHGSQEHRSDTRMGFEYDDHFSVIDPTPPVSRAPSTRRAASRVNSPNRDRERDREESRLGPRIMQAEHRLRQQAVDIDNLKGTVQKMANTIDEMAAQVVSNTEKIEPHWSEWSEAVTRLSTLEARLVQGENRHQGLAILEKRLVDLENHNPTNRVIELEGRWIELQKKRSLP